MAMSPMRSVGPRRFRIFWAARNRGFTNPGLYVWAFKDNRRILPVPRRRKGA